MSSAPETGVLPEYDTSPPLSESAVSRTSPRHPDDVETGVSSQVLDDDSQIYTTQDSRMGDTIEMDTIPAGEVPGAEIAEEEGSPFHVIGACFFCTALVMGILLVSLASTIADDSTSSKATIFGVLFGAFCLFLFMCLFFTYFLGSSPPPSDGDTVSPFWNLPNVVMLLTIVVEFVQLTSFAFHEKLEWAGEDDIFYVNYVAAPMGRSSKSFQILFWVMFGVAFSPYVYIITVRGIVYYLFITKGEEVSQQFVEKHQSRIYSSLQLLVTVLYFPVLSLLFGGLDCRYEEETSFLREEIVFYLDYAHEVKCFEGKHIGMFVAALVAIVAFYPAASFAQAQAESITDVKMHPKFAFILLQAKFVLALLAVFLRLRGFWGYMATVLVVDLIFLVVHALDPTCPVRWVRRMKIILFSLATWAAIAAMINRAVDSEWVPLFLLLVVWAFLLFGQIALFLLLDRTIGKN
jgi:hypothetical protein